MKQNYLLKAILLLLCIVGGVSFVNASEVIPFSMTEEAAEKNTPEGWTAVDLPTGLPTFTTENTFDITSYGASTSSSDNTTAIQAALDAAASAGGGMVVIPAGEYLTSYLTIGSKTVLHLCADATLKMKAIDTFGTDDNGYHTMTAPLITGKSGASDIVIEGESRTTSIIDGQGAPWWDEVEAAKNASKSTTRQALIRFWQGSRYLFRNFRIQNAPNTNICIGRSGSGSHATAHDITIKNPASSAADPSHNTDGFPIWTQYVNIYDCEIDTGDDNVVTDSNAQFVHVWNCQMKAGHGASLGSYTQNMHDILYENLTFTGTDCGFRLKSNRDRSGDVYNITFRNCTMTNVMNPIQITTWYDTLPSSPEDAAANPDELISTTPRFRDILIKDVTVTGYTGTTNNPKNGYGIFIYGRPESKVRNVTFDNVNITHSKGIKMNFCEGIKFKNCSITVNNDSSTDEALPATLIEENYQGTYLWNSNAYKAVLSWQLGTNGAAATAANSITGASGSAAEGFTIAITGNTGKNWTNGNGDITYNSTTYKTLKNSNGAQNTVTLPSGMYAHKVDFYAVVNSGTDNGKLSEFNGESCNDEVSSYQDYSNPTHISKEFSTGVNSFTFTFSTNQVCFIAIITYSDSETLDPEPEEESTEFAGFSAIVNNQTGTLLTSAEQVQGTAVSFGVAVDNSGNTFRVATDDASSIATISGTYHSDHGMTGMSVVVPVPGKVTIQIGKCTYSTSKITVTNSDSETVLEYTPVGPQGSNDLVCWKNNHNNIIELTYEGEATTLTISGMGYCPFIAVKKYVEPAEFADFSAIVNNQTGTLLTAEEQIQNTAVSFGVAVDNSGNTVRVATDDASSIATISGTYHSDHGMTGMSVVVPVPGKVTIQIGTCTYSTSKITVTNSSNEKVIEYTPTDDDKKCWKNDHSNIIELEYTGEATTLTISGMGYCPFVAVKKKKTTVEKALYSTDFSEWTKFFASTTASNINKTTNYTDETLTFTVYNTALMSVNDTKFESYTNLPHNALQAAKAADPYVTTSKLGNITKVRYIHGATGGSRGWKLEAKGDGDTDWVTISNSYANPAGWCEVTQDINRTNCQLRFTNLNSSQNAYMFELEIFGEVELTYYEITGTISGGDINGSTITLTGNGDTYTATVADDAFTMSVPAGTYTISLSDDVPYLLSSPTEVTVSAAGSIGAITIEAAQPQTVTGAITNAPNEAFTLTFTGGSHNKQVECAAGATSYSTTLDPDIYVISSNVGTLSTLSLESFKVVKTAATHNIYFPETIPAATQQNITVDNTATVAANIYNKVSDALAAAKAGSISSPVITLTSGQTYREQVIVDQANVTFKTSGTEKATITFYYGIGYSYYSLNASGYYDKDRAMTRNSIKKIDPARWGATVLVKNTGNGFKADNIIFENSFNQYYTEEEVTDGVTPNGVQSITYDRTLRSGDDGYKAADAKDVTERAAAIGFENNPTGCELYNCKFIGSQDTYYTSGTIYMKNCTIQGNTDFIFGGGNVVFDNCDLVIGGYSDKKTSAYITANSPSNDEYYIFRDCTVKKGNRTYTAANLGRDWGGTKANVVYFNLKNELGSDMSFSWTNMGGAVSAGTANLHIYDFDPTVNSTYSTTGSTGANVNGVLSETAALTLYAEVVERLGFTPTHIYEDNVELGESSAYNICRIAASDYVERNVTLTRAIPADRWNTIVLPFDMTAEQITATFGDGTQVAALASGTAEKLSFTTTTTMKANQPYAIKVPAAITAASPKTINGVTIKYATPTQAVDDNWQFVGTYASGSIPQDSYFFSGNKLWQAEDDTNTIKGFRAYFTYNGASSARNLTFTIDDDSTTGINAIGQSDNVQSDNWYDLQGRQIVNSSNRQTKKGLYIVNGKKVVIK